VNLNGTKVAVTAQATEIQPNGSPPGGKTNFISVIPDTRGVTRTGTAETNDIGGDHVTIGATGPNQATPNNISHEFGHLGGAGDQYATGVDVNGSKLKQDAPGASGVMYLMNGGANDQSMREILHAPTNSNSCAPGVTAANGGC
jgi:hypothetical protein